MIFDLFRGKAEVCRLFAETQICAQVASFCAQMSGEQSGPGILIRVLGIISLWERNIKS